MAQPPSIAMHRDSFDDASWLMIALSAVLLILSQIVEPFTYAASGVTQSIVALGILLGLRIYYVRRRKDEKIAGILAAMAQMILFTIFGAILTYMSAAQGGAHMWDETFQRWDRALGFDWLAYLQWTNAHPTIGRIYNIAYITMIPQLVMLIMALAISGRLHRLRVVMFAATFAGIATVVISGLTPAMSNYIHLNLTPAQFPNLNPEAAYLHKHDLMALRDGSLRTINLSRLEGIVTFPSYHSALGAIFVWGFLKAPRVGWLGVIWATVMILATPIDGAHYLVDVLAGAAIAMLGVAIGLRVVDKPWLALIAARFRAWPSRHLHAASAR